MAYSGQYIAKNPKKYKGDHNSIYYRSSLELRTFSWLDHCSDIIQWSSEEIVIPYKCPTDNYVHRYFPDLWVKTKTKTLLIEIKPKVQTYPPKKGKKVTKTYITEVMTWLKNGAKWDAARKYATDRNWEFEIWTEEYIKNLP